MALTPPDRGAGGEGQAAPSQASAEAARPPGAARAIGWSVGGQLGSTLLSLVSTVVLARLLTPVDFGAFTFAATIYAVVQWLLQVGMGQFLLREAELTRAKIDGAVAVSCLQGLAGSAIVLAAAPLAGWFSHLATVGWVTLAVAPVPFLNSAEAISDSLWLREGRLRRVALLQVAKAGLQSLVSILCRLLFGWGVFALVAGLLAASLLSFAVAAAALRLGYRARPALDRDTGRALRRFGGRSFALTVAQILSLRLPDLLIGRLIGVGMLGHYSRASNARDMFVGTVSGGIMRATAARFYAAIHRGEPMPGAVTRYCDTLLFFLWPGLAGMAALSAPVVRLIFGPQWTVAVRALPLLCLAAALDAARTGGMEVLLVRDRIGLNARMELARAGYAIALTVGLAPLGIVAVLWGKVAEATLTLILYLLVLRRLGAVRARDWPALFGRNALLALAACAPALLLMRGWGWPAGLSAARFAAAVAGGVASWLLLLAITRHPFLAQGLALARARLAGQPRPGTAALP